MSFLNENTITSKYVIYINKRKQLLKHWFGVSNVICESRTMLMSDTKRFEVMKMWL